MRFELEDTAQTGLTYEYNDETDMVEVGLDDQRFIELSLEAADRWRTGKARFHCDSGLTDVVSAQSLTAAVDDASEDDGAWLQQLGIEG